MKKQLIKDIKSWLIISTVIIICLSIFWFTYAAITQVASWDILTATKFNSLIDASYHTAAFKKTTADFTVNAATWNSDSNWNVSIDVKNNDLILVSLEWLSNWSAIAVWPMVRINLISWPWVFFSSNNAPYNQGLTQFYAFNTTSIIRATWDWTINLWYQWYCWNPWTCLYRNVEVKAFTIWKYQ